MVGVAVAIAVGVRVVVAVAVIQMLKLLQRNIVETTLKILRVTQAQAKEFTFADEHGWDIDSLPGGDTKAYKTPRNPAEIDLIVCHVTAVTGGFGVSKRQARSWHRREVPNDLAQQAAAHFGENRIALWSRPFGLYPSELFARRLALWSRYRYTPYHQIAAQNGDVIANRRLSQRSWHGDSGNAGVGFAVDCGHKELLSPWLIDTGRAALRALITRLRNTGNTKVLRVAPHRSYSGARRLDTNHHVWSHIVKPVVETTPDVRIDYEAARGKGRPVPRSWDDDALYDDRGRRL